MNPVNNYHPPRRGWLAVIDALYQLGVSWNETETPITHEFGDLEVIGVGATASREREPEQAELYYEHHS